MTQAVIEQDKFGVVLRDGLEDHREEIERIFGNERMAQRFMMIALTAATKSPKLRECGPRSIFLAVMESAHTGLMPDGREAVIIPYKGIATFTPMFQGINRLMLRSPGVLKVEARVVREGDDFDYAYGMNPFVHHKPLLGGSSDRPVIAAYAIAKRQGTDPTPEVVGADEIERARAESKAPDGPHWIKWYDETARKVPVKRLGKYLDLSPEATRAIDLDNLITGPTYAQQNFIEGVSEDYMNQVVKGQTQASLERLKEEMNPELKEEYAHGLGANIEDSEPQETDLGIESGQEDEPAKEPKEEGRLGKIRVYLTQQKKEHKGTRTNDDLVQQLAIMMSECLMGAGLEDINAERHRALLWMWGKASTKDLTGSELRATLDYLRLQHGEDDKLHPSATAAEGIREIARFMREAA